MRGHGKAAWRSRYALGLLLGGVLLAAAGPAEAVCKLLKVAEWQVDVSSGVPIIDGSIDGKPVRILIATGSDHSFLRAAEARRIGLPLRQYSDRKQYTTAGVVQIMTASVKQLQIGSTVLKNLTLPALDNGSDGASEIAFLIGADFFSAYDTEFDLAHGAVRLFQREGCKPEELLYWSNGYFMSRLTTPSPNDMHLALQVLLNGNAAHAWLSTAAGRTYVGKLAAQTAGTKPGSEAAPLLAETYEGGAVWDGRFDTLGVGNETIHNARLRVTDLFGRASVQRTGSMLPQRVEGFADVLLGMDFLMAHRILILPHDHQMLFTYNGGSVFAAPSANAPASPTQQH